MMNDETPTYEQAIEAKKVLLAWVGDVSYMDLTDWRSRNKAILYGALTQEYFLGN